MSDREAQGQLVTAGTVDWSTAASMFKHGQGNIIHKEVTDAN